MRRGALEHQGTGDQHPGVLRAGRFPAHVRLFHLAERMDQGLTARFRTPWGWARVPHYPRDAEPCRVWCLGNLFGFAGRPFRHHTLHRILAIEDAVGPRHDFVMPDLSLKQRGRQRAFPVGAIVVPAMVGIVFNGIIQIQTPRPVARTRFCLAPYSRTAVSKVRSRRRP